jgi:2-dehydro-3-deoxygluconokinase
VDRVGGGDAFASGIIYGYTQKWPCADIVEFAAAASCLKHTVPGDCNMVSVEEVKKLAAGDASEECSGSQEKRRENDLSLVWRR